MGFSHASWSCWTYIAKVKDSYIIYLLIHFKYLFGMYGLSQGHGLLSSKLMIAAWDVVSSKVCGRGVECESSEY